jgi:hypothetical protein
MTVTNKIYQIQIKYHLFNAVANSELTELVLVFTIRPALPTCVKKVNTSFKNVWRTWGPTLLAGLMIFCPLGPIGPTNFKNSVVNVNETTPKLTRPEQTTQKCHQTAFKMSTLQQCPQPHCQVSSLWSHTHIVKWALYGLTPTSSSELFMVSHLHRQVSYLWSHTHIVK